tara:strand:- start:3 stop:110 length:108 start_codon:yes stop_codon:yes gene_type:complete
LHKTQQKGRLFLAALMKNINQRSPFEHPPQKIDVF